MKKRGFTLAEVLIVLVILGVIASMTVPSLMNSSNQQVYLTGLQKAFGTINNAITLASVELGITPDAESINKTAKNLVEQLFVPTLKTSYASGAVFQTQDGVAFKVVKEADSCDDVPMTPGDVGTSNACFEIIIDTNGPKGPNRLTTSPVKGSLHDQFQLLIYRNGASGGEYVAGYLLANGMAKSSGALSGNSNAMKTFDTDDKISYNGSTPQ